MNSQAISPDGSDNEHGSFCKMAKKKTAGKGQLDFKEFGVSELARFSSRGIHPVLTAMEEAIQEGIQILNEVWEWVINGFKTNDRAMGLVKKHRPDLCQLAGIAVSA